MATAATASAVEVDTRNLEWKSNNVGSKLLAKMGWKEGQGIGKRRKLEDGDGGTIGCTTTEGLRVKRRVEGLGLGASPQAGLLSNGSNHVADFSMLLAELNQQHGSTATAMRDDDASKSSGKKTSGTVVVGFATNKSTHAKVRKAKFSERSADDYKSIFAGASDHAFATVEVRTTKVKESKQQKKKESKKKRKTECSA